jgi:hypothetical protein
MRNLKLMMIAAAAAAAMVTAAPRARMSHAHLILTRGGCHRLEGEKPRVRRVAIETRKPAARTAPGDNLIDNTPGEIEGEGAPAVTARHRTLAAPNLAGLARSSHCATRAR